MNEEKYFVPPIEDIRIGYEFELIDYSSNKYNPHDVESCTWTKHVLKKEDIFSKGYEEDSFLETCKSYLNYKALRVSFLTKEQIENEGWKEMSAPIITVNINFLDIPFEKDQYRLDYDFKTHMISLGDDLYYPMYRGECKSINEFRYICKLLKIEK